MNNEPMNSGYCTVTHKTMDLTKTNLEESEAVYPPKNEKPTAKCNRINI